MDSDLTRALTMACDFLVARQDADGHWRDYELPPGRSESWTTACVGLALESVTGVVPIDGDRVRAIDGAVAVLHGTRRAAGWGYNRRVACDADSTSWAVRLIAARDPEHVPAPDVLADYLTEGGGVRTFSAPEVFGSWAYEHDEVAPMAGRALAALGDHAAADAVRSHLVRRHRDNDGWTPFWWCSEAYVVAHNLAFLAGSGGVPPQIAVLERVRAQEYVDRAEWMRESSFELAHRLLVAVQLGASDHIDLFGDRLLTLQLPEGGWSPSSGLLVPGQWDSSVEVFADECGLLSTAMAVLAVGAVAKSSAAAIR
ncbi:hypothetical protein AB0M34_10200 [Nocardia sp. NPDC050193]